MKPINLTILGGCIDGLRFKGIAKENLFQDVLRKKVLNEQNIELNHNTVEYTNLAEITHKLEVRNKTVPVSVLIFMVRSIVFLNRSKCIKRTRNGIILAYNDENENLTHVPPRKWATKIKKIKLFEYLLPKIHFFLTFFVNVPLGKLYNKLIRKSTVEAFEKAILELQQFAINNNTQFIVIAPLITTNKYIRFYTTSFHKNIIRFCEEKQIQFIDIDNNNFGSSIEKYLPDQFHLTADAHNILGKKLYDFLKLTSN